MTADPHSLSDLDALVARLRQDPGAAQQVFAALHVDVPALALPDEGWESASLAAGPDWQLIAFALPAGEALPLHDHPGMHVLTRVLRGRLELEVWDLPSPQPQLATPGPTLTLGPEDLPHLTTPTVANVHGLRALEDAVFLDLFAPYYAPPARVCTYYRVVDGQTLVRAAPASSE